MATPDPTLLQRLLAEFFGTFVLVFGGCGSAVLAAIFLEPDHTQVGVGFVGVSLAFGLAVLTMAYAVGHISGGHFNPAVTLGLAAGRRFAWRDAPAYIVTQVVAAIVAATVLFVVASGKAGFSAKESGFASTGMAIGPPGATACWPGSSSSSSCPPCSSSSSSGSLTPERRRALLLWPSGSRSH